MTKVLVVDDDPDFVEITSMILKRDGFEDEYVPISAWITKPINPEGLLQTVKRLTT